MEAITYTEFRKSLKGCMDDVQTSPNNAARLLASIGQAEAGQGDRQA